MKKLHSIFTDNMEKCIISHNENPSDIERHHVFGGFNRKRSEKYGFIAPLDKRLHPNGANCSEENWRVLDHHLKQYCQEWYEENVGTREQFIAEFGRNYIGYEVEKEK